MRCGCPHCEAYMVQSETEHMACVCPDCGYRCNACLGTNTVISRDQLAQLIMVAVLKQALSMEEIAKVLSLLCAQSVEDGYTRFCTAFSSSQPLEKEDDAVTAAIVAALCVVRAKARITAL